MTSRNENGFFNGLLWGLAVGGGLVFLLGTKKGKRLLRTIADEGIDKASDLEELFGGILNEEFPQKKTPVISDQQVIVAEPQVAKIEAKIENLASPVRRFFRRVPKKTS